MEISALVQGTAWYQWRRAEDWLNAGSSLHILNFPDLYSSVGKHSDLVYDDFWNSGKGSCYEMDLNSSWS